MKGQNSVIVNLKPRCLRRNQAAAYLGMSGTKFGTLVRSGDLPEPLRVGNMVLWDTRSLDDWVDDLQDTPSAARGWED